MGEGKEGGCLEMQDGRKVEVKECVREAERESVVCC